MKIIAHIRTDFQEKFGIPRQSGLVETLHGKIIFEPEYRYADALRGLDEYSHLWLIWQFSKVPDGQWSPLVRPPRLGGNQKMGVFATRSPYRPNPIGLSVVAITKIELQTPDGPVIHVAGADLMDGTPIYDIKPYLPYVDCQPEATAGFATAHKDDAIVVVCEPELLNKLPKEKQEALIGVLAQDPRPAYQQDDSRIYGMAFAGFNVQFQISDNVLTVLSIIRI